MLQDRRLKYFTIEDRDYRCSHIFNHCRIDQNGDVFLFENKPFIQEDKNYWTSGHTNSYDYRVKHKGRPFSGDWKTAIIEVK